MNKTQALHSFWAGFGWPAYEAASVPDSAQLPYITHETSTSDFNNPIAMSVTLWDKSSSWSNVVAKEMEISSAIGRGGIVVPYDGGAVWLIKASPWSMRLAAEDDGSIKRIVLNYISEWID